MPPPSGTPAIRAVILTYGEEQLHRPLIDILLASGCSAERILVVHNPRVAGDAWAPTVPAGVDLLLLPANVGYAGGMNAGMARQRVHGEDLLLLTHDARPQPGALSEMLQVLANVPQVGVLGPCLDVASDGRAWSAGVLRDGGLLAHRTTAPDTAFAPADAIDGTIMLIRSAAAEQVGEFDQRFFMYFEESDFCLRATRLGWDVGVAPSARALTEPGAAKRHAAHAYFRARNGLAFGWRAARWRGLRQVAIKLLAQTYLSLPRPWAGAVPSGQGQIFVTRLVGTSLGIAHFLLRRWGPPPGIVLRLSDISGVS